MILHLPALTGTTIDTDTLPTLYVIQEGINCMSTTDYLAEQRAATQDPVSQQTHPSQPGKTRVHPSMLADKQVPVLNLTKSNITSQADLQDTFQSICLCSHG